MDGVCGRFAPSPSGRMHLGNLWSCLLAWLSARSAHGRILLRLEDLDPDRCRPEYSAQIMRDLEQLDRAVTQDLPPEELIGVLRGMVPTYYSPEEVNARAQVGD